MLEKDGQLVALELKTSRQADQKDATGITAFRASLGSTRTLRRGAVLHGGQARPLGAGLWALPWRWMVPE